MIYKKSRPYAEYVEGQMFGPFAPNPTVHTMRGQWDRQRTTEAERKKIQSRKEKDAAAYAAAQRAHSQSTEKPKEKPFWKW